MDQHNILTHRMTENLCLHLICLSFMIVAFIPQNTAVLCIIRFIFFTNSQKITGIPPFLNYLFSLFFFFRTSFQSTHPWHIGFCYYIYLFFSYFTACFPFLFFFSFPFFPFCSEYIKLVSLVAYFAQYVDPFTQYVDNFCWLLGKMINAQLIRCVLQNG